MSDRNLGRQVDDVLLGMLTPWGRSLVRRGLGSAEEVFAMEEARRERQAADLARLTAPTVIAYLYADLRRADD